MTAKDMFIPVDRVAKLPFEDKALELAAFSQDSLDASRQFQVRQAVPYKRERILQTLGATTRRVHQSLEAAQPHKTGPIGSNARTECRISFALFQNVEEPTGPPGLGDEAHGTAAHWPYCPDDPLDFVRLQANRWLDGIASMIATARPVPQGGQPAATPVEQHAASAVVGCLLALLRLTLNSRQPERVKRLWAGSYYRRGDEPSDQDRVDHDGDNLRQGLGVGGSLRPSNLAWLPHDLSVWDRLRFRVDVLTETAYAGNFLQRAMRDNPVGRVEEAFRATVAQALQGHVDQQWSLRSLRRLCYFGYSTWILTQLGKSNPRRGQARLPGLAPRPVGHARGRGPSCRDRL